MKNFFTISALLAAAAGCVSYQLQPVSIDHPANAEAKTSTIQPSSRTLAYTSVDMPTKTAAAAESQDHDSHHGAPGQTAAGEGKVVATAPDSNQLVIAHGAIKGVMDAMTMGYPVDPPSLLEGLKPGDNVRFTMDLQRKTIVNVEKLNK